MFVQQRAHVLGVLSSDLAHVQCEELRLEQCKMSREKELIENQLEAEQEYIVNKLQKQAMRLATEKQALQLEKTDLKRQVLLCTILTCLS